VAAVAVSAVHEDMHQGAGGQESEWQQRQHVVLLY